MPIEKPRYCRVAFLNLGIAQSYFLSFLDFLFFVVLVSFLAFFDLSLVVVFFLLELVVFLLELVVFFLLEEVLVDSFFVLVFFLVVDFPLFGNARQCAFVLTLFLFTDDLRHEQLEFDLH